MKTMKTRRLTIRRFLEEDKNELYRLLADEDVMHYLEPPYSLEKTESFLSEAGLCELPLIYAVDDKDGMFVGYVIYHPYDKDSYEIGWVIHKNEWYKGYAQELTEALIQDASACGKSVVIECVPEQEATRKIAINNGFTYIGYIDQCDVYRKKLKGNNNE